ncbi:hypothetical protein [Xanthomonas arboricola]|uniref:hypothetical protein n=1 Tax=Xanthomonas arboricola TaxID=56448 RepID=UPI000E1ECD68|nr:hypothetical protein [Xanthomonas arboricola]
MKTALIALLGIVAASVCVPASAQVNERASLRAAATGQTIVVGHASFRLIPGAVVRVADAARATASTQPLQNAQTSADTPIARFDRYAIYLDSTGHARTAGAQQPATIAAALETRSGQLALLGASIKLFDTTPAIARALATVSYTHLDVYKRQALDNCAQLQGSKGVGAIKPEVIPRAARPL